MCYQFIGLVQKKSMEGVLVVRICARTPSDPHRGTIEHGSKPPNAHIEPCDEHSRVYLPIGHMQLG